MPPAVTCRGLLLRSYDYSDSSRIFRFLTPDRGVVSLIGRGIRGRTAKGEAPIQTFGEGWVTFTYRPQRDLHPLEEFQSAGAGFGLARDLRRLVGASLVAEILLASAPEEEDPELYEWVTHVVRQLSSVDDGDVIGWVLAGGWRTLAHLGYPPETARCVRCGGDLSAALVANEAAAAPATHPTDRFDAAAGGLVCPSCGEGTSLGRMGTGARNDLRALVEGVPPPHLRGGSQHLSVLEAFALHHLSPRTGFKSFDTLRQILNAPVPKGYS